MYKKFKEDTKNKKVLDHKIKQSSLNFLDQIEYFKSIYQLIVAKNKKLDSTFDHDFEEISKIIIGFSK